MTPESATQPAKSSALTKRAETARWMVIGAIIARPVSGHATLSSSSAAARAASTDGAGSADSRKRSAPASSLMAKRP
jgi:hypothetical protein